ncbi:MAG TPA: response regulator [Phycisphaerae bacterium]|nr:response regulator [Phycisphaerae bacterium]
MPEQSNTYVAVIDDDECGRRAMARLLRAAGIQAITYASAEEFLRDEKRPAFDCLVLDIQLAELSGIDLQQRLANGGGCPPTIFITANDDPGLRERAESLGCVAYLRKTASGQELLQMIHSVLSKTGGP